MNFRGEHERTSKVLFMLGPWRIEHGTLHVSESVHGTLKFLSREHGFLEIFKSEHVTLKFSIFKHEMIVNCIIDPGSFDIGTFNPGTADHRSRHFPKRSKRTIILLDFLKVRPFGSSDKFGALRHCTSGPGSPDTILNCILGSTESFTFELGTKSSIRSPLRSGPPVHESLMTSSSLVELHIL